MAKEYKYKTRTNYKVGTVLTTLDDNIVYEVIKIERIGITDECNFGMTLIKLNKKQVKEFLK